jgi:hypothetical protein
MKEKTLATASVYFAAGSITLSHVAQVVSIIAGACAVIAALPVIYDRWGPIVRKWWSKP